MAEYIAHKRESEDKKQVNTQALIDHLNNVGAKAAEFASGFHAESYAEAMGLMHDIGKYSAEWQRYILGGGNQKIDHSTAGAQEAIRRYGKNINSYILAYCISGHHSGLLNGGSRLDESECSPTLGGRLNKKIPSYEAFRSELGNLPVLSKPSISLITEGEHELGNFSVSFFIRILYSCLVDADFLDTEEYMSAGEIRRQSGESISILRQKFMQYIESHKFLSGAAGINKLRSGILRDCLEMGRDKDHHFYTLTVPTGGGKTIASMAFALEKAVLEGRRHVIYVIPYCSIIEQTVDTFSQILGEENVLAAYSNADYDSDSKENLRLATENWDKPIIITTAVQFFESFYSNRSSTCRKLHNIVNSVIVFDEAQTFPVERLKPCVRVLKELMINYSSDIVLCTATQPALQGFFQGTYINRNNHPLLPKEICSNTSELYEAFKRVQYDLVGELTDDQLVDQIQKYDQALCIVSTRKQAKRLFELIECEGRYHLSTNMTPHDRRKTLEEIRRCLRENRRCIVISTSLIEAGVDVDFPAVFRASAGLDSIIQAAGRCNREGRKAPEDSHVIVFSPEHMYKLPASLSRPASITDIVTRDEIDVSRLEVVKRYFEVLYNTLDSARGLDVDQIVESFEHAEKFSYPFSDIAKQFHIIDSDTVSIFVPEDLLSNEMDKQIVYKLQNDMLLSRKEYHYIGEHSISIFKHEFEKIRTSVQMLDERNGILMDEALYSPAIGFDSEKQKSGEAIFG